MLWLRGMSERADNVIATRYRWGGQKKDAHHGLGGKTNVLSRTQSAGNFLTRVRSAGQIKLNKFRRAVNAECV